MLTLTIATTSSTFGTSGREFPRPRRTLNVSSTSGLLGGLGPPRQNPVSKNSFGFYLLWDILGPCWDTGTVGIRSRDASHCVHQLCIPHYPQSDALSPSFPIKIGWRQRARERYAAIKKSSLRSAIISQAPKKSAPVSKKRSTFHSPSRIHTVCGYSNGSWR